MHLGHDHSCGAHGESSHGHHASFDSQSPKLRRTLVIGMIINAAFVVTEFVAGWLANSVALLADAAHNLGDVCGLGLSWLAVYAASRAPNQRHTWGYRRSSMLAALAHAVALISLAVFTIWEGAERFFLPSEVHAPTIIGVALVGILINGVTAVLLFRHDQGDLNVRGAFLHMLADMMVSVGVVVTGILIAFTNWLWLDPVTSFIIAGVILATTWKLLTQSLALNLDAVPSRLNLEDIAATLGALPGVDEVHDLHVWSTSTTSVALTAHLVRSETSATDSLLAEAASVLRSRFGITHSTLQIESTSRSADCERCD